MIPTLRFKLSMAIIAHAVKVAERPPDAVLAEFVSDFNDSVCRVTDALAAADVDADYVTCIATALIGVQGLIRHGLSKEMAFELVAQVLASTRGAQG